MANRVKINSAGIEKVLKSDGTRALLTAKAERVLAAAQSDPHDDTYAYERSLTIVQRTTDRAVVRVQANDWKGAILEDKYRVLTRALGAARG